MPIATTKKERFTFILESERGCQNKTCQSHTAKCVSKDLCGCDGGYIAPSPADQTVFILRSWTWTERAAILKLMQLNRPQIEYVELGLRFGLIGWENFKDGAGRLVDFPSGEDTTAKLESINGLSWGVAVYNEIFRVSFMEEAERKN